MRPIPQKTKDEISSDSFYERCAFYFLIGCEGRVTIDHTIIYGGRQIDDLFNLVPVCAKHHGVDKWQDASTELPKDMRLWVAVNRATEDELLKYSKVVNYKREKERLNATFGTYTPWYSAKQKEQQKDSE